MRALTRGEAKRSPALPLLLVAAAAIFVVVLALLAARK
jgi:hypothetical protein